MSHKHHQAPPDAACRALVEAAAREPYARKMGIRVLSVEPGRSRVEMRVEPDMLNVFGIAHGGAVFSVIDEAFQLACNAHGTTAYALNLSITYVRAAASGDLLFGEVSEVASTLRTATYQARVTREDGEVIAVAQAVAYRKKEPLPFASSS